MNVLKIIGICCVLCPVSSLNAQTITLRGTVKDSLQSSLPYANIIAKPKDMNKIYNL